MNYDNELKKARAAKAKAEAKLKRHQDKILELKQLVYKLNEELYDLDLNIGELRREKDHKRACQLLEKAYDYLHMDEVDDDVVWFSCDLYDEHNEESDPYYDAHFAYSWRQVHDAFLEYITIAHDKKVTA